MAGSLSLGTAVSAYAQDAIDVPEIGIAGASSISIAQEQRLGDFYMRQLRAMAPIADDPVLREYLSGIGNRLIMHTDNIRYPFTFFWVNDSALNAFAFLGGYIGIHTGIIMQAETESELASVVSHEIAHVSQRHIARNMERMTQAGPTTMTHVLGSIIVGLVNPAAGMAGLAASVAGAQQRQINYTRQFELEADRIGINALFRAGFDPEGAPSFFGRLAEQYRYTQTPPEMLITHPLPDSRVADTRNRAMQYEPRRVETSLQFELAKARIRVRYADRRAADVLKDLEYEAQHLVDHAKIAGNRYGRALAHLALEEHERAYQLLMPLRQEDPMNLFYLDTETDILMAQQRSEEAVEMLQREYIRRPNNQVITLNLAYAANAARNLDLSRRVLNNFIIYNKKDVLAWDLLHTAYELDGKISEMHEARAEIFALRGDFRGAIEQLHTAISKTEEDATLTRQRMQARIEQFRALEQERVLMN
ncbi:M48 family peptidase [Lysobacter sp. N42]|nr:M48 family peptidase [Aliidiomarina sp. B3213]TCZ93445.1 M48 family peptidase [Lysobacter sp. N42]